ncbi:MAG: BlaI/MecI/CopY family transcriptional regulator [Chitinophagaceae bacterium]|nr:BlaI/MecI/CopY family transcriptional regulator [Chitinophagaceae bacterium]
MEKLTHTEEETMQAVWRTGEANVKAFMENMDEPAPYTTVASIVKNLEKKGYLSSRLVGNAYLYKPAVTEEEYKKKFMHTVVKEYFDSSYKELVNFFVEQKKLSAKELKEIINLIEGGKTK